MLPRAMRTARPSCSRACCARTHNVALAKYDRRRRPLKNTEEDTPDHLPVLFINKSTGDELEGWIVTLSTCRTRAAPIANCPSRKNQIFRCRPESTKSGNRDQRAAQAQHPLALQKSFWVTNAAAVLSATSTRAEGEPGALLQTLAQRRTHQRARRPGAALALHVAHEAESALGDHLAGRAVARIAVARDYRLDPSAIRQVAQEEDVVETLLALFPSRACAGFETAGPEQENHRGERLCRHANDFPKSRRDHHLVVAARSARSLRIRSIA